MGTESAGVRNLSLSSIVGDLEEFLTSAWQSRRAVGAISDPTLLRVLTISDVEQILSCSLARFPYVKLSQDGTEIHPASYVCSRAAGTQTIPGFLDADKVSRLFTNGATIVLSRLDEWYPPVARVCYQIGQAIGGYVEAGGT